jgi:CheY-like chemotaxis protein
MRYVKPGSYVQLTVTDSGTGMDAETIAHIFEPFFTTKEKGKGTGLGLSTVYGIIKQSGGYILVESEPGKGSSFKIFLPREMESAHVQTVKAATVPAASAASTVLVVEDEESLRDLIADVLSRHGYRVLTAPDGAKALEAAREHRAQIQLLLTDVVLPGIGGPLLAKQLASEQPGLRTLYMSGYSDFNAFGGGSLPPDSRLLHKPFTKEALLQEVGQTLAYASEVLARP